MTRLIDADALKADIKEKRDFLDTSSVIGRGEYIALNKALTMLDEQPTVDAVQVVRCGECSHSEVCKMDEGDVRYCHTFEMQTEDDYYCADGERKDDGKN